MFTVSVLEPAPDTACGLNVAVLPDGNPLTLMLTVPVNPAMGLTLIVYVVLLLATTVWVAGDAESEKSPG